MEHSISFPLKDKVIIRFSCGARRWLGLIRLWGANPDSLARARQDPVGRGAGDCAAKCCLGCQCHQIETFCFCWRWHVICQVMRFQKLRAQTSAHEESSHLLAGGEEAESLVMPWLEETAVMCTGRPLHCRSSWNLGSRQVNAPGTAGSCSSKYGWKKGKAASSSYSGQQRGNETIDHENVSLSGRRWLQWLGLGSTQAIRLVVLGCEPQTLLGQRMSRGRSPWRCLTMPRKFTSGPAYLKSEANMYPQDTGIGGQPLICGCTGCYIDTDEKLTVVELIRLNGRC